MAFPTKTRPGSWTAAEVPSQHDRTFVITGANSGIGFEAAKLLAAKGGSVLLACRNEIRATKARDEIRSAHPEASVEVGIVDLASLASVRAFADRLLERANPIDVLVNNAGIMALPKRSTTADGFEAQFGTNHLGHFALTGLLLPLLLTQPKPRVVNVSSNAHRFGKMDFTDLQAERKYRRMPVYGQSKLANLLFTMELQRRFDRASCPGIAVACHPGYAATNLGVAAASNGFERQIMGLGERWISQSAAAGALPTVRAATDPGARGGDYFGPDGAGQARGAAAKVSPARAAFDVHDARELWEQSIVSTGVDYAALVDPMAAP
jgi:NAD(P)-dependent dehydrogenase (short-subunit alcohol dehydrogenase family)